MRVLVALLAALVLAGPAQAWTRVPVLDQVASEIAGRPVQVQCQHAGEYQPQVATWTAYTWWTDWNTPAYVALSPRMCWSLLLLAHDPSDREVSRLSAWNNGAVAAQGEAILTLAHEAVHMTGVRDEGVTECRAMGYIDMVMQRFGVPPQRHATLREGVAWAHRTAPPEYLTVC